MSSFKLFDFLGHLQLVISLYGIYNMVYIRFKYSDPTSMNFMGTIFIKIRKFFSSYKKLYLWTFLRDLPRYIYILIIILICSNPIRNQYWSGSSGAR